MEYVLIGEKVFEANTTADILAIQAEMSEACLGSVDVWVGDPTDPDSYRNGRKIFLETGS